MRRLNDDLRSDGLPSRCRGLTLVEVLVVISIIAVLMTILLPVAARVREQSRKVVCASNLQKAGAALQIYANANHGKLPQHPANMDHHFLYMLPLHTAEAIVPARSSRDMVYCPSGDLDAGNAHWGSNSSGTGMACITGYHWFIQRFQAGPTELFPPNRYHASFGNVADPATAELAADLVISHRGKFTGLSSTTETDNLFNADRTSHLRRNNQPDGGNILYLDGHVAWRAFKEMKIRGGPNDLWY